MYKKQDHLFREAKREGLRSRAAYKLQELDKKHRLLRHGACVVDLGSAPGGWLQVAAQRVGRRGTVIGIDLEPLAPFTAKELNPEKGAVPVFICGDMTNQEVQSELMKRIDERADGRVDVLLSDMSPKLSGIGFRDAARSAELAKTAFQLAEKVLRPGGTLVAKIFPGPEAEELHRRYSSVYGRITRVNLQSSRKTSKEMYFIAKAYSGRLVGEVGC